MTKLEVSQLPLTQFSPQIANPTVYFLTRCFKATLFAGAALATSTVLAQAEQKSASG